MAGAVVRVGTSIAGVTAFRTGDSIVLTDIGGRHASTGTTIIIGGITTVTIITDTTTVIIAGIVCNSPAQHPPRSSRRVFA
ncbi:MAG: hypothetical protein WBA48_07975 [Xanthobacteraceae bacterium]